MMISYLFWDYRWWIPCFGSTDFNGSVVGDIFGIPIYVVIVVIITVFVFVFAITVFRIVYQWWRFLAIVILIIIF